MSQKETCFFERYAIVTLQTLLGHDFDGLVNRDRPDIQSPDGRKVGIEVTRAMEQDRAAAEQMLDAVAGMVPLEEDAEDFRNIISSGYGYGLQNGRFMGTKEKYYWELARPLKSILENKVSKAVCGLYGSFDQMGLFVFCKDPMTEAEVIKTVRYVLELQKYAEGGYDTLFLSEIGELHVCNLREDVSDLARIASFEVCQDLRREFFLRSIAGEVQYTPYHGGTSQ